MKIIQNELFETPEEETSDSCYVYHKTRKNMQFYGEILSNGSGRLTIYFDKITEDKVRSVSQSLFDYLATLPV